MEWGGGNDIDRVCSREGGGSAWGYQGDRAKEKISSQEGGLGGHMWSHELISIQIQ